MLKMARELAGQGHRLQMIEAVLAANGYREAAEWLDQPHITRELRDIADRSGCAHAYIANQPLLHWLAETQPMNPEIRVCAKIGYSIDAAFANLPKMYALFPMIALQKFVGDCRIDPSVDGEGRRRRLIDPNRYRPMMLFYGPRVAELLGLLLLPFHWLTLDYLSRRSGRAFSDCARELRTSGRFDAEYDLRAYPDVAASGRMPMEHYLYNGRAEGRRINATGESDRSPG